MLKIVNHQEIRSVKATDHSISLSELMNTYGQDVWNFAFSLTRSPEMADDILQDVFIKAYLHIEEFRGEASIKTWLLAITRNTVSDYKRSAFIRKVTLFDSISKKETHPSAEKEYIDEFIYEDIWKKVLCLPVKLREVLVLHAHHGLSEKEIAHLLNIPHGTVKSRLHHARNKMSKWMEDDQYATELGERTSTI